MFACGYILANETGEQLKLSCFHCRREIDIDDWNAYALHIRNADGGCEPCLSRAEIEAKDETEILLEEVLLEHSVSESAKQITKRNSDYKSDHEFPDEPRGPEYQSTVRYLSDPKTKSCTKFSPSLYRKGRCTLSFIECYQKQPCLWNIEHPEYGNQRARLKAYESLIAQLHEEEHVLLTEDTLKKIIQKLHVQYKEISQALARKSVKKLTNVARYQHGLCSFLKASRDVDAHQRQQLNARFHSIIQLYFKAKNPITTKFVTLCSRHTVLHNEDLNDFDYLAKRRSAFNEIATEMRKIVPKLADHITGNTVRDAFEQLRRWYYQLTKADMHKKPELLAADELFYVTKCAGFLPHKYVKQKLICTQCGRHFYVDYALQTHLFRVHKVGELPYGCRQCECSFETPIDLRIHLMRKHKL